MISLKSLLPAFALVAFTFTACKKDKEDPAAPTYQPVTANSTWTYNVHNNINAANDYNFTITSLGTDTAAAGKTYKIFTNSKGANEYYAQDGSNYYQFGSFQDLTDALELTYLKTNVSVGSSYEESKSLIITGFQFAVPATFKYTIAEKLPTYTVNTQTFSNVYRVKVDLAVQGLVFDSQSLNFYYAEGVGRIRSEIQMKAPLLGVDLDNVTTLTSYNIAQ